MLARQDSEFDAVNPKSNVKFIIDYFKEMVVHAYSMAHSWQYYASCDGMRQLLVEKFGLLSLPHLSTGSGVRCIKHTNSRSTQTHPQSHINDFKRVFPMLQRLIVAYHKWWQALIIYWC